MGKWTSKVGKDNKNNRKMYFMSDISYIDIGCISCFGVSDEELITNLSWKIVSLSTEPKPPAFSKAGEMVPNKAETERDIAHMKWDDIEFTHTERNAFDKFFLQTLIKGVNNAGDEKYTFIVLRLDRFPIMNDQIKSGNPFNLYDYCTVKQVDIDSIAAVKYMLQMEFLFRDEVTSVRIFPSLPNTSS